MSVDLTGKCKALVIPAKAGIQVRSWNTMDSRFRGNDTSCVFVSLRVDQRPFETISPRLLLGAVNGRRLKSGSDPPRGARNPTP
jgi:hypothetical protein